MRSPLPFPGVPDRPYKILLVQVGTLSFSQGAAEEWGEWRRGGGSPSLFPPPQRLCAWGATTAVGAPPLPPSSLAPKPEPPPFGFTPPARVAWAADDASRDAKRPRSPAWLCAGAERTGATMRHPVGPRVLHTARELVRESKAILSAAPHPARLRPTGPFDAWVRVCGGPPCLCLDSVR